MSEIYVRLLQCLTCRSLEQIPDYEGDPQRDDTLNYVVSRHRFPDGNEHRGHLHKVEAKHWLNKSTRRAIENQIRESSGHTGFETEFYSTRSTLEEDALSCFQKHLRNPACPDYRSDQKRLQPDTKAERRDLGLENYRSNTFLCNYCPVHSLVMSRKYDKHLTAN